MPPRRRATLATLYRRVSSRTRIDALLNSLLLAAGKLLALFLAVRVAEGDAQGAAAFGALATLTYGGARLVSTSARVNAECDLQRAVAQALLESDVLDTRSPPPRTLFEPLYHARALVTDIAPDVVASGFAALGAAPLVAMTLPSRALVVSAMAMAVVVAVQLLASRKSVLVQRSVLDAYERMQERSGFAIEGRLELVAWGAEDRAMRSLDDAVDRYRAVARRAAWTSAMLGRAPLAAGLGAVLLAVLIDASYRAAVTSAILGQALVLAACLAILLGLVLRTNELLRTTLAVAPLLDVFAAPRRRELMRKGNSPPELPADVAVQDVGFAYAGTSLPTLRALSLSWPKGKALLVEGPNGSGKSTLLRLLLALHHPQRGSVTVDGLDLAGLDLVTLRRGIAYLPQRPYLGEPESTVRSSLCAFGDPKPDDALQGALARVGLATAASRSRDLLDTAVGELSAGQRQRVALARVLLQDASIYLLDEPDANLDRAGISLVGEIVRELVSHGRMVAVAAHSDELASIPGTRLKLG